MCITIDKLNTITHMTPGKAHETAATLNADKYDDWTYTVRHIPGGKYSVIECYEPSGAFIGTL